MKVTEAPIKNDANRNVFFLFFSLSRSLHASIFSFGTEWPAEREEFHCYKIYTFSFWSHVPFPLHLLVLSLNDEKKKNWTTSPTTTTATSLQGLFLNERTKEGTKASDVKANQGTFTIFGNRSITFHCVIKWSNEDTSSNYVDQVMTLNERDDVIKRERLHEREWLIRAQVVQYSTGTEGRVLDFTLFVMKHVPTPASYFFPY